VSVTGAASECQKIRLPRLRGGTRCPQRIPKTAAFAAWLSAPSWARHRLRKSRSTLAACLCECLASFASYM